MNSDEVKFKLISTADYVLGIISQSEVIGSKQKKFVGESILRSPTNYSLVNSDILAGRKKVDSC